MIDEAITVCFMAVMESFKMPVNFSCFELTSYISLCMWIKSMPMMLSFTLLMALTVCVNFFPLTHKSILKMPIDDIITPDAATQFCAFDICHGLLSPNAISKECLFMYVTATPISKRHEKDLSPTFISSCSNFVPIKRHHSFTNVIAFCNGNHTQTKN
jgi:hypothetical protein